MFLVPLVPFSHIHRYPCIATNCRSCFGVGLLKELSRTPTSPLTFLQCRLRRCKSEDGLPKMEYRTLPLSCECGRVPKTISALGLSSTHDLVIHWHCPRCHKTVCIVKPLSDCWQECFTATSATTPKATADLTVDTPYDRRFLHSLHVRYSEE